MVLGKVLRPVRRFWLRVQLAEAEQRLDGYLEDRAADKAGWYVGNDHLEADIRMWEKEVAYLRKELGYQPHEPPRYYHEPRWVP